MGEFASSTAIDAPRESVWELISDHQNWLEWTPARVIRLDPEGSPEADGVGAVRHLLVVGSLGAREEIVAYEAPEYLAYRLLGSFPVSGYESHMRLTEADGATTLEWSCSWNRRPALVESPSSWFMARTIRGMANGIKAAAERRTADDG